MHPVLERVSKILETPLEHRGDVSLLDRPRRALLVSRVERNIEPSAPWLIALRSDARALVDRGEVLVTGTKRVPFDLPLWMAKAANSAAIIVLSSQEELDETILPKSHLIVWPTRELSESDALGLRDRLIGLLADRATDVHIRKGGNMAVVADEMRARGIAVDRATKTRRKSPPQIEYSPNPSLLSSWQFLTHYTRAPEKGIFPGEPYAGYLANLASDEYQRRDGLSVLRRILAEGRIRGSGRLMPDRSPMVCLTALPPASAITLRKWRRGLHRWTFAPYGIAFPKSAIENLGGRALIYSDDKSVSHIDPRFVQPSEWSNEHEWRVAGDVDFSAMKELMVVCAFEDEARQIAKEFGVRATSICKK